MLSSSKGADAACGGIIQLHRPTEGLLECTNADAGLVTDTLRRIALEMQIEVDCCFHIDMNLICNMSDWLPLLGATCDVVGSNSTPVIRSNLGHHHHNMKN